MATWIPPQRTATQGRPWLGRATFAFVAVLVLLLLRILWSGSTVWYLVLGLLLLGAAAVTVLARRPPVGVEPVARASGPGSNVSLLLAGSGVVLLALLLVPTSGSGGSEESAAVTESDVSPVSEVSGAAVTPVQPAVPAQGQDHFYVVQSGDTLWDIAQRFGVTVEALVEANDLDNPADLTVGQRLAIPGP